MAKITNISFKDSKFKDCKLLGLRFDECNKFGFSVEFESCQLNLSTFYKQNLKNSKFKDSSLREVDFTESNLTNVIFNKCDLSGAIFKSTLLEKSDFRTSYNYSIDPELNRIKKAKFSLIGVIGLLDKYDIQIE